MKVLVRVVGLLLVLFAVALLMCPLYYAVTRDPWYLFLFFVTPFLASVVGTAGLDLISYDE